VLPILGAPLKPDFGLSGDFSGAPFLAAFARSGDFSGAPLLAAFAEVEIFRVPHFYPPLPEVGILN